MSRQKQKSSLFLKTMLLLGMAFLYMPLGLLIFYSFNKSKLVTVWGGFSTRWYLKLMKNSEIWNAALLSLKIAVVSSLAAVVLGVIWGGWHLPLFLIAEWETPHRDLGDLLAFLAFTVAASIVLSWITNTARGSVLLAILAHNAINWAWSVWEKVTGQKVTSLWPAVLGLAVLAVIAVAVTRGRLGYRSSQ